MERIDDPVRRTFRPEVQALRAIAVAVVLVFHVRPTLLPGGYVGVDVFFVISGFLITGQLMAEIVREGRVGVVRFWARRVRRLLPAAFVVLLVSAVLTLVLVPSQLWHQFLEEVIASALYVQNWVLAENAVDYLASAENPSIVQHFWSLSVEEQFYLALPLLLAVAALIGGRRLGRRGVGIIMLAIVAMSFAYSLVLTAAQPSLAYFATTTRAWEFAAGGVLACVTVSAPRWVRALASWLGLAAIGAAALAFNGSTAFPGVAAVVPVAGALAVIWAGDVRGRAGTGWLAGLRPVQYVGGISYSLYLWHWPLVVVLSLVVGSVTRVVAVVVLLASFVLAALTKYFVEDRFRRPGARARVWPAFALMAAGAAVVVAVAGGGIVALDRATEARAQAIAQAQADNPECWAAEFIANSCAVAADGPLDPEYARLDLPDVFKKVGECVGGRLDGSIGDNVQCSYGDADSATTIVLVGDSHAGEWMPPLELLAEQHGWRLVTLLRSSCPFGDIPYRVPEGSSTGCTQWRALALDRVLDLHPARVFTAALTGEGYAQLGFSMGTLGERAAGFEQYLGAVQSAGIPVTVFADTPFLPVPAPDCLAAEGPGTCTYARTSVLDPVQDALRDAAVATAGVQVIDLDDLICLKRECATFSGGVVVYYDNHHLTATYSRSLARFIDAQLSD